MTRVSKIVKEGRLIDLGGELCPTAVRRLSEPKSKGPAKIPSHRLGPCLIRRSAVPHDGLLGSRSPIEDVIHDGIWAVFRMLISVTGHAGSQEARRWALPALSSLWPIPVHTHEHAVGASLHVRFNKEVDRSRQPGRADLAVLVA